MNSNIFYQLPKAFIHNPKYMFMKSDSKIAYSLLKDLLSLSIKNGWVNELNQPFVRISREKLMTKLQCAKQKITQIMNELKEHDLIVEKTIGQGKTNIIYICVPDDLNDIFYDDDELLEMLTEEELKEIGISKKYENQTSSQGIENTKKYENQTSKSMKIKRLKVRISNLKKYENQTHIDTNNTDTNLSDTNHSDNNNYNKKVVVNQDDNDNNNSINKSVKHIDENPDNYNLIKLEEKSEYIERIKEEWRCHYRKEITNTTLMIFINLLNKYDVEMITILIDLSKNATTNINSYIKGIVRKWTQNGINTVEDYLNTLE